MRETPIAVVIIIIVLIGVVYVLVNQGSQNVQTEQAVSAVNSSNEDSQPESGENEVMLDDSEGVTGNTQEKNQEALPSQNETDDEVTSVKEIEMEAKQWSFEPRDVYVNQGQKVRLIITSTDVDHGILVPGLGINQELPAGETKVVEFTAEEKGEFEFICNVYCGSGHSDMRGKIVVE